MFDDADLEDGDEWMHEFLGINGNNTSGLADLLINEKYNAPWILRPDYFDTYFRRIGFGN